MPYTIKTKKQSKQKPRKSKSPHEHSDIKGKLASVTRQILTQTTQAF
jgi:hypothetical protein